MHQLHTGKTWHTSEFDNTRLFFVTNIMQDDEWSHSEASSLKILLYKIMKRHEKQLPVK